MPKTRRFRKDQDRKPNENELAFTEVNAALLGVFSDDELRETFGPDAADPAAVGFLASIKSQHVPPLSCRSGDLLALVCTPYPTEKSDLLLFTAGCVETPNKLKRRRIENVRRLHYAVIDYDRGDAPLEVLSAKMESLGLAGVVYRSPSDGKDTSEILRCKGIDGPELCAPTVEACTAWLIERGYKREILGTVEILDPCKIERENYRAKNAQGQWETREVVRTKIVVRHNPLAKTRAIVALKTPFARGSQEPWQAFNERWGQTVLDSIVNALGFVADPSCYDVSRAFYLPSATPPSGAEEICRIVFGPSLDLNGELMERLRKDAAGPRKQRERALTERKVERRTQRAESGQPTGRHRMADMIAELSPDRVRGCKGDDLIVAECPFDELHSDCGNPYDSAFWATNSGACGCYHTHGAEHEPADYVAKMVADGWFTGGAAAGFAIRVMDAQTRAKLGNLYQQSVQATKQARLDAIKQSMQP